MYLDVILLASSSRFYAYDIMSCDTSCDCSYMPLHCLRNKEKIKFKHTMTNNLLSLICTFQPLVV